MLYFQLVRFSYRILSCLNYHKTIYILHIYINRHELKVIKYFVRSNIFLAQDFIYIYIHINELHAVIGLLYIHNISLNCI